MERRTFGVVARDLGRRHRFARFVVAIEDIAAAGPVAPAALVLFAGGPVAEQIALRPRHPCVSLLVGQTPPLRVCHPAGVFAFHRCRPFVLRGASAISVQPRENGEGVVKARALSPTGVTTGLDPVVHAEMQRWKTLGNDHRATPPHGMPDQVGSSPALTNKDVPAAHERPSSAASFAKVFPGA